MAYERDDLATAQHYLRRGLDLARQVGDPGLIDYGLARLGQTALEQGDLSESRQCFAEGLALARETGDRYGMGLALIGLGYVDLLCGHPEEAQLQLQEGQALSAEIGDLDQVARAGCYLGELAFTGGDLEAARRYFQAVVQLGTAGKVSLRWPTALVGLARVSLRVSPTLPGLREQALALALLLDQPERSRQCRLRAQALRTELESQLTPQRVEAVRQQAQGQSLEAFATALFEPAILSD